MVDWIPSTWEESQHSNLRPSGPITVADSRYLSKSPRCRPSQPPSFITSIKSLKHTHFLLTYNKPCYLDLPYTTQAPPLIPHIPPTPQPPCLPFSKRTRTPEPNPFSRATVMTIEAMSFTFESLDLCGTEPEPGLVSWEDTVFLEGKRGSHHQLPDTQTDSTKDISPCKMAG